MKIRKGERCIFRKEYYMTFFDVKSNIDLYYLAIEDIKIRLKKTKAVRKRICF